MAFNKLMIVVVMLVAIAMVVNGQSICRMTKDGLKSCQPSASGENPVDPPAPACCSAIAKADLKCLCHYKDSGFLSFYGVDPNEAMELPVKCKLMDSFHC